MDQSDLRGEILIFMRLYGFFRLVPVFAKSIGFASSHGNNTHGAKEVQDAYMVIGVP